MTTPTQSPLASALLANIVPPPSEADIVTICPSCSFQRRLSGVLVTRGDETIYRCPKDQTQIMAVVPSATESDWVIQAPNDWWVDPRGPLT